MRLLFKLFEKQFLKYYFNQQSRKPDMEKIFVDSNGIQYYTFKDRFSIPIMRFQEMEKRVMLLQHSLSDRNIDLFCDAMEKALNKGKNTDIATIGHLVKELRSRKEILLNEDMMFDLVALWYIKEGEDTSKVDEVLHAEKIAQFKKDSVGGLYDFFYQAGLKTYLPYLEDLKDDFNEFIMMSNIKLKAIERQMTDYITK
jgi:hypothetical protein